MKIVQINSFSNGSTGKIMMSIHSELLNNGFDSYVVWGRGRKAENKNEIFLNDKLGIYFHAFMSRITGKVGFYSKKSTKKLIKKLEEINPDIVHLHNIHGYYINIELLFNYLKKHNIKVIWTLHDCWPFTGKCAYFDYVGCDKWKEQCYKCPMLDQYPKSLFDASNWNYKKKKQIFSNANITFVTPSNWLANLLKSSFLNNYPVEVINNGIDLDIFKPTKSNFREKNSLMSKKIILGVASVWDRRKGLEDFLELSKQIDEKTIILLVGLSDKQIKILPKNIIGITRTENQKELAGLYTTADIFFNPTKEDNFPTVNLEALACGTPVFTYNTGGSPECIYENNGKIVTLKDMCDNYKNYTIYKKNKIDKSQFTISRMTDNYIKKIYK